MIKTPLIEFQPPGKWKRVEKPSEMQQCSLCPEALPDKKDMRMHMIINHTQTETKEPKKSKKLETVSTLMPQKKSEVKRKVLAITYVNKEKLKEENIVPETKKEQVPNASLTKAITFFSGKAKTQTKPCPISSVVHTPTTTDAMTISTIETTSFTGLISKTVIVSSPNAPVDLTKESE